MLLSLGGKTEEPLRRMYHSQSPHQVVAFHRESVVHGTMSSTKAFNNTVGIEKVVLRAKGIEPGPVLEAEVELARNILRKKGAGALEAIFVVGLCGTAEDAPLLEMYLHGEGNNLYAEYAIKALCRYLGMTDQYRPLLRQWITNRDDAFRRIAAIHLAKEYFRGYVDNALGRYLIDVLCDLEDNCRHAARSSLTDILNVRDRLNDPFGLVFADWDDDATLIVEVAAAQFGYDVPTILHRRPIH